MKVAYIDTSCVVALTFGEPGAPALRKRLGRYDRVLSSALLEAEVASVMRREGLSPSSDHWSGVRFVYPDRSLRSEIARTLEAGYLRGADCWHVATALFLAPDPSELTFLTLDAAQASVARRLGFRAS